MYFNSITRRVIREMNDNNAAKTAVMCISICNIIKVDTSRGKTNVFFFFSSEVHSNITSCCESYRKIRFCNDITPNEFRNDYCDGKRPHVSRRILFLISVAFYETVLVPSHYYTRNFVYNLIDCVS